MPSKFNKCKFHILAHDGDEALQVLVDKFMEYIWTSEIAKAWDRW